MKQLIQPNPDIPCKPGWCLAYVNEAFSVDKRYGRAIDAWDASDTKHKDHDYPAGVWLPVWFTLANEPAGHVALRAPDGSVYSTSDLTNVPHHHPSLEHLESYYAYYGMPLSYLGWTEDVEGTPVVATPFDYESTVTVPEGLFHMLTEQQQKDIYWQLCTTDGRAAQATLNANAILDAPVDGLDSNGKPITTTLRTKIRYMAPNHTQLHNLLNELVKDAK